MVGDVSLGGGDDYYDGRRGTLVGSLLGGAGADTLFGGSDDDNIVGGTSVDRMAGGDGDDIYAVDDLNDVVNEGADRGEDTIQTTLTLSLLDYPNVENLRLLGVANLAAAGDANANLLVGNFGNNVLSGAAGNDVLMGGFGADRLIGGDGIDRLFGGAGNDVFAFASPLDTGATIGDADRVADFTAGDRIDLSAIDANLVLAGNNAFTLDAGGAFTVGEIRQTVVGTTRALALNLDDDALAEMVFLLPAVLPLGAAAFVL